MIFTLLRRIAGTFMALLSLASAGVIAIGLLTNDPRPSRPPIPLDGKIIAYAICIAVSGLFGWAAWMLFRRPTPRKPVDPANASDETEPWRLIEGEVFWRPWYFIPIIIFALLLAVPVILLGVIGLITGIDLLTSHRAGGYGAIGFGLLVGLPSSFCFVLFCRALKMRGLPLAIVSRDALILPGRLPYCLNWSQIASIRAFNTGKTAFMELMPTDPTLFMPRRRGWWHGPWRDGVYVGIGNAWHPLVQATKRAHADWHKLAPR